MYFYIIKFYAELVTKSQFTGCW